MTLMERRRALIGANKKARLPAEYQEVEWIGTSDAGPYIQTNVILTNGPARLHIKYSCSDGGPYGRDFFGIRAGSDAGQQGFCVKTNRTRSSFYASSGNMSGAFSVSIAETGVPFNSNSIVEVDASLSSGNSQSGTLTSTFTVNGVTGTASASGITGNNTIKAISIMGSSNASTRAVGKIYGKVEAWNDDNLVLYAIPCYRKADSVIGMYDIVNKVFYVNAGSRSFTKGADV